MPDHLFVYGTLRSSCVPPELQRLAGSFVLLGPATAAGVLYDLGPYPGAVFEGDGQIAGEVFELPDARRILAALDEYEGFLSHDPQGSLYIRVRRTVALSDGRGLECWAYTYQGDVTSRQRILGGDWLRR